MGFFIRKDYISVDGRKKQTNTKAPHDFTKPKTVAIPLKHMNFENFEVFVQVGDKVKIGTKLAERNDHFKMPIFATVSGTVTAIEKRDHVALRKVDHVVIENDFLDETDPHFTPIEHLSSLSEAELREKLQGEGVQGLGGAAFPTYAKFSDVDKIQEILINGVECEPYLTADEANMEYATEYLMSAANAIRIGAGAKKCVIAVKETKKTVIDAINKLMSKYQNIELRLVPDLYPMGWERRLIKEIYGKSYDKLPIEIGIVVLNSSTAIEFARTLKTGLPMYEKIVTIGGEGIAKPQNVRVRVGTILSDILTEIGGYNKDVNIKSARLVHGGPMMGESVITDNLSVTQTTGGFLCLYERDQPADPCSKCGTCVDHCPKGLQPVQIALALKAKSKDMLATLGATECIECGMCSYVCPSNIDVTDATSKAKKLMLTK